MVVRLFKNAIVRWWKNINLCIIGSLISIINPFFLLLLAYVNNIIFQNYNLLKGRGLEVSLFLFFIISIMNFFPTTFVISLFQKRIFDKDDLNIKDFLSGFFKKLLQTILPWLGLTLFFGITSLMIMFIGGFYSQVITEIILKNIILLFVFYIFAIFISTQYVFFPLYVYEEEKIKISNAIKFAMEITLRNQHIVIPLFLIDFIILMILLLIPYLNIVLSTTLYFGFSNSLKLSLYHELIRKYTEPKKAKKPLTKTSNASPWRELLESKKEMIKNK